MNADPALLLSPVQRAAAVGEAFAIDLARCFGPLASMHAALDRIGIGMPCSVTARFPGRRAAEVDAAIAGVVAQWPILRSRLVWREGRPVLCSVEEPIVRDDAGFPGLGFRVGGDQRTWRYQLAEGDGATWLTAVWTHAVADGLSMLRFVEAVRAGCSGHEPVELQRLMQTTGSRQRFVAWLPMFLRDQQRPYVRGLDRAAMHNRWTVIPPQGRDQILRQARADGAGMGARLAAAAVEAFATVQQRRAATVLLNLPISRVEVAMAGGFGFGVGSLRFPVRFVPDEDLSARAQRVSRRWRRLSRRGWDRNLECLIGQDPKRHLRFARAQAGRPPDPNLTVSWKGTHPALARTGDVDSIACFASAPTLHVSAHADANGLSLSVTGPHLPSTVQGMLDHVRHLLLEAPR